MKGEGRPSPFFFQGARSERTSCGGVLLQSTAMSPLVVFWFWVLLLAALLFLPVSNLVYVVSVRRKQRKLQSELNGNELAAQKQRARFLAIVICFLFSFFFNVSRLGFPVHG